MTTLEEEVVIQEILDLDSRRFLLRIYNIEDIANRLLATCDAIYVGPRWISNFVKRQSEFYKCWNGPYNYQRAQYEDLKIIETWFRLFQNIITKYNIIKSNIWNFDKINFLIGQITPIFIIMLYNRYKKIKTIQPSNRE